MSDSAAHTDIDHTSTTPEMPHLTHRQVLTVMTGLMLGMLVAALSQTVVATALPTIVGELGGQDQLSWVVSATLLASTASTGNVWSRSHSTTCGSSSRSAKSRTTARSAS